MVDNKQSDVGDSAVKERGKNWTGLMGQP